jgi:ATP-binding cassette, subfamily C, bacterial exporter for protease/lipase
MNKNAKPSELALAFWALKPLFVRAFAFGVIGGLLILAPTFYMFEVYERVVNSRSLLTLGMLTVLVLLAFVVMECIDWARAETMREAGALLDQQVGPRVFDVVYQGHLHKARVAGVQPMNDFRTLRDFLIAPLLSALMEAPAALVFLVVIYLISPLKATVALLAAVLMVVLGWWNQRQTTENLLEANRTAQAAQQYADSSLRNAEVIQSMGMLKNIQARWIKQQSDFLRFQARASESAGAFQAMSKMLQTLIGSVLLGLGAWLLLQDNLPGGPGMMIVASVLGGRVLAPLVALVVQWRSWVGAREAWARLSQLMTAFPPPEPTMAMPAPKGALLVDNLVASAPGSQTPILKGVHFALQPGEVLAVVGPSASGKTTLARLLVGVWPAASGKVRLDGADVYTWSKRELGPYMGYLPQGVELMEGSLADNIARFGEVNRSQVQAAARSVGLHELIESLPQSYDTQVGAEGAVLSGGQRQRVGLARALYGDPVLVVLDEPNASLDDTGDAALAQAIRAAKARGTTFVVITHRTSVLAVADKMLVLKDGAQQAFGPRDEVLAALRRGGAQPPKAPSHALRPA